MKIPPEMLECCKLAKAYYTDHPQNDIEPEEAEKIPNAAFVLAAAAIGFSVIGTDAMNNGIESARELITRGLKEIGLITEREA